MVQFGEHLGFRLEALARVCIDQGARGKNLEGNEPVQALVVSTINDAHPAGADPVHDAIMSQYFPSQRVATHVAGMVVCALGQVNSAARAEWRGRISAGEASFCRVAALPEWGVGPACFGLIPRAEMAAVGLLDAGESLHVAGQRTIPALQLPVGSLGGGQSGEESIQKTLSGERIKGHRRISCREPGGARTGLEHRTAGARNAVL